MWRTLLTSISNRNTRQRRLCRTRPVALELLEDRCLLSAVTMTEYEQLLLELVNRTRANPAAEAALHGIDLNAGLPAGTISNTPKQPLAPHQTLIDIAQAHSQDMLDRNFFEHDNPDGQTPSDRGAAAGYTTGVAENIAFGAELPGTPDQEQYTYDRHAELFISQSHRLNIVNASYTEIGTGARFGSFTDIPGAYGAAGTTYNAGFFTENFGNPSKTYITGVVYTDNVKVNNFYSVGESVSSGSVKAIATDGTEYIVALGNTGGYALDVPAGSYTVIATSGVNQWWATTTVGSENVKVDFETLSATPYASLSLSVASSSISENGGATTATVSRTGSTASPYTVNVWTTDATELSAPTSVTIPAGHASTTFTVNAVNDSILDGVQTASVSVGSATAPETSRSISVTDHEEVVSLTGTSGNDTFVFNASTSPWQISVNGVVHTFDASSPAITLHGSGGSDTLSLTGTSGSEDVELALTGIEFSGANFDVDAFSFETVNVNSGGGTNDRAYFYDSAADDLTIIRTDLAYQTGGGIYLAVSDFDATYAYATAGGNDTLQFYDSAGNDTFIAKQEYAYLSTSQHYGYSEGYETISAYSTAGGTDAAQFYDSTGNDSYTGRTTSGTLTGPGYSFTGSGFDTYQAFATAGGDDIARLYDGAGNDTLEATPTSAILTGPGLSQEARHFENRVAYATAGGTDRANFRDSAGDDTAVQTASYAYMVGTGFYNYASQFEETVSYSTTGNDVAQLYDSTGDDRYVGTPTYSYIDTPFSYNLALSFPVIGAYAPLGGTDVAQFYDDAGQDEVFVARPDYAYMTSLTGTYYNYAAYWDTASAWSSGGNDSVQFYDSSGNDYFITKPLYAYMRDAGSSYYNYAYGFASTFAYAIRGGNDEMQLYDSAGSDTVDANSTVARITNSAGTFDHSGYGFDTVRAFSTNGGTDVVDAESALAYVFSDVGAWL